ncbi:NAD dependent epimerase/dehydratase family protein, partial [Vibrio parahaemolyticus AQ3810]
WMHYEVISTYRNALGLHAAKTGFKACRLLVCYVQ